MESYVPDLSVESFDPDLSLESFVPEFTVEGILFASIGVCASYWACRWKKSKKREQNISLSDAVPSDQIELKKKVIVIEAEIKLAEVTKNGGDLEESNIQFNNCAKSLNTLRV